MNTPTKLGGYGALLAMVFAAAFGVGAAVGTDPLGLRRRPRADSGRDGARDTGR